MRNIHVRIWNLKFDVHVPLLEEVKIHWPSDGRLTYWTSMPSLEPVCFGLFAPNVKNNIFSQGTTPASKRTCFLTQVLVTNYEDQIHFGALPASHQIISKGGLHLSLLSIYKNHHAKWKTQMMMWDDDLEDSPSKRWPLRSLVAIKYYQFTLQFTHMWCYHFNRSIEATHYLNVSNRLHCNSHQSYICIRTHHKLRSDALPNSYCSNKFSSATSIVPFHNLIVWHYSPIHKSPFSKVTWFYVQINIHTIGECIYYQNTCPPYISPICLTLQASSFNMTLQPFLTGSPY